MLSTCSNQGKLSNIAAKNPKKPGRYYNRTVKYDTYEVSLTKIKNYRENKKAENATYFTIKTMQYIPPNSWPEILRLHKIQNTLYYQKTWNKETTNTFN